MAKLILSNALSNRIDRFPVLKHFRWSLEAGTLGLFWQVCARMPPHRASAFGRGLFAAIGPKLRKSSHMRGNLALAFPDLDEAGRENLLRQVWGNTGAVFAEYPHLHTLCQRGSEPCFEIVSQSALSDYQSGRKQAIFVTAHVGNWELGVAPAIGYSLALAVVYAPISNPIIDRMFREKRAALGCELLSRGNGLSHLVRALAEGKSLGLVVDHRDDRGVPLPFFGLDKLTTVVPARLALRFGCDLVPTRVERLGPARFRVTVYDPVRPDPALSSHGDQAAQMMIEINRIFEHWIRERPEQWLCTKRAWAKEIVAQKMAKSLEATGVSL